MPKSRYTVLVFLLLCGVLIANGTPADDFVDPSQSLTDRVSSVVQQAQDIAPPGWVHAALETLGGTAALIWLSRIKKVMRVLAFFHSFFGLIAHVLFSCAKAFASVEARLKDEKKPKE